jgi:hypothetical protein
MHPLPQSTHITTIRATTMDEFDAFIDYVKDYLKEAIADFGEDIVKSAATPAKRDLFEIDENSPALTTEKRETFHRVVAKLLYVSKRGRLDIQLATAFFMHASFVQH